MKSPASRLILALALCLLTFAGCTPGGRDVVVVYTSQDQIYSEPILRAFTEETGIQVRPVYDSEAVKTVGLANRLLAEKSNPQCDLFWNNEELRTWQLAARDVFRVEHPWRSFGYRSRRLVINTNLLPFADAPQTLLELTNQTWRGKVALAYPMFGTTATHFQALRQHWGEEGWENWCRALQANDSFVVDGNSVVVQFVGRGDAWIGLTDSDDIDAGRRQGLPIEALPIRNDSLLIPNTVAIVRNAPRPESAQKFLDYLTRPDVVEQLAEMGAIEGANPAMVDVATIQPDFPELLRELEPTTEQLKSIFLR
ncbi:MAG TPA: extracellular solute-binding protein [Methylomirabilota bacterium]|nr:extracellular solute-binding protein [Methylomirabilota bacterium]